MAASCGGDGGGMPQQPLQLYIVRISPPCRAVWQYLLLHDVPHTVTEVDFGAGEDRLPEAVQRQPLQQIPLLLDLDLPVFQGPAILRHVASRYLDYKGFGFTPAQRSLTDSLLSWANSDLHRVIGYDYVYPQFLPHYALSTPEATEALVERATGEISRQLEVLERRYLGTERYLVGSRLGVADLFVASVLVQLEWTNFDFRLWPKVHQWLDRVKRSEFWDNVHSAHEDFLRELQTSRYQFD